MHSSPRFVLGSNGLAQGTHLPSWHDRHRRRSPSQILTADDVALLAEMLSVLVLALEVMNAEAQSLDMTINWRKTKILDLGSRGAPCQRVSVQGNEVKVVESFVHLGSLINCLGGSESEIKRRTAFIHESMFALDQITSGDLVSHWKPCSGSTIRAFSQYFSMVLRYGA